METYDLLISGLVVFMALHLGAGIYVIRTKLVKILGEKLYRIIHSIGALAALFLIVEGFAISPKQDIYQIFSWGHTAPFIIMPLALIFLIGSLISPDMKRITRHPLLWAIILWSGAHLLANGDQASIMLFGSFFVYGILAIGLNEHKKSKSDPVEWEKIKAQTSIIPFAALIQGRAAKARGDYGVKAIVAGLFLYSFLLWMHGYISGVPLIGA